MKKIYVIGAGVEGQEGFSRRALELVMQADILFGRPKQLALFPDFSGEKVDIDQNFSDVVNRLKATHCISVVLASGDPLFFGIGRQLLRNFSEDELEFVPNVSSVQYAFAKLGIPWDDAVFLSCKGHASEDVVDRIVASDKVAVLTDAQNTPASLAREMMHRGREGYAAYLCENLGTGEERIVRTDIRGLLEEPAAPLNVLVLVKQYEAFAEASRPVLGIADDAFSAIKKQITREEVRAVTLAKLRLCHDMVLWDIGAGSGSVSIEADHLMPNGKVFAIEQNEQYQEYIRQNLRKFESRHVTVVEGEAPGCLELLPDPDRVFIGGSGGSLWDILEVVDQRLGVGGRVVVNAITLDTLAATSEFLENAGYQVEVTSVNIARTRPSTDYKMFEAFHPVFILVADKE
ncbi:MAG: precorrin-6B C5,15-methyltransferase / cobalt-precorrin-6B C5,C15-methyltransferase [Desulfuromonadales bacterium]|jgi:precorrin-6Y C5,15-methyltransferase (decarboxylating)|nr:precorrin-6B C5,15-methyltransferase / cobalt-precorrin-6B C5,C15-methyltransferase [Desulfuromonadales bacterium]